MTNLTIKDLKSWDKPKILDFVRNIRCKGETLHSAWNESVHPEYLFYDFYDEVMVKVYTDGQKALLLQRFKDEGLIQDEHMHITDLDEVLKEYNFLKEDCGEDSIEIIPKLQDDFDIYMFKWLLNSVGWGDEFLVAFANGSLDF